MPTGPNARAVVTDRADGPVALIACGIAIAAAAVALRIWRLSWGLGEAPGQLGFPDEGLMWVPYIRAFTPLSWSSFETLNLNYPTLYGYLVGLTATAMRALDLVVPPPATLALFRSGKEALLLARGTTAFLSLVTVGLVGLAATRMYSRRVGLAAAALAAVLPFEVVYAHIASPDTLLATCTVLVMLLAYEVAGHSRPWLPIAVGVAAGAATATKYTGLAMLAPAVWATAENVIRTRSRSGRWLILVVLVGVGFALGFSLGCPPCLLHADRMMEALRNHLLVSTTLYTNLHNNFLAPAVGWHARPYAYQLVAALPFALGWPLYALALCGVGVAAWRHTLADRVALATIVPYFLAMGGSQVVFPRYLLPLLPVLAILAARAALAAPWRRVSLALFAAVWIYSAAFAASHVARFSLDQQRGVAEWIADAARARTPSGRMRVGAPHMMLDYFRLAGPLAARKLRYLELPDGHWFDDPPEFFVLPHWYEIAIERDTPESPQARDLAELRAGTRYELGKQWRSSYLQQDLYTALDPAFTGDVWQGEIGFAVYVRKDVVDRSP